MTARDYAIRSLLTLALLTAAAPASAHAQAVVEVDDRIGCSACTIEVGPPVELSPSADQVWFTSFPGIKVARDRKGNFIVSQVDGDGAIGVFDSGGAFVSAYGKIGDGPGEFASSYPLFVEVGEGDILYAIDSRWLHTLAPRADSSLNQVRMPVQAMDAVAISGGIAIQGLVRTEAGNTTIQILNLDGTIEASLGIAEASGTAFEMGMDSRRVIGRANNRADVWSAPVNRYRLLRFGTDGEEMARIDRNSEWFRPYSAVDPGAPFRAPAKPSVAGIHQDADGLIWVAVLRAPASFTPLAPVPGGVRAEAPINTYLDLNRFLHTTIEVIDPVAGHVVARRDFDNFVAFVSTPSDDLFVYWLRPDYLGDLNCIVAPLELRSG